MSTVLKIVVVGRFYEEGFAAFVADELAALGHSVWRFDPGPIHLKQGSRTRFYINRIAAMGHGALIKTRERLGFSARRARLQRTLEAAGGVDMVLSTHDYLSPADAEMVKTITKAPLVLWYPDPVWSFQRHMFINAPYDLLLFKDPYLVQLLRRKLSRRVRYMPECYSDRALAPEMAETPGAPRFAADICTAGNLYAYRVALFQKLAHHNLKVWGLPAPLWLKLGALEGAVQNEWVALANKVRAFRGAKIVLNTLNPSEIWGTNVRTFEICGAGAFQIVDDRPGLAQLFEPGREVVTFDDAADLAAKVDHYLADAQARAEIAAAGHARAKRDHTYKVRLPLLVETAMGRSEGYPEPAIAWRAQTDQ